jgi:hypothetical protein
VRFNGVLYGYRCKECGKRVKGERGLDTVSCYTSCCTTGRPRSRKRPRSAPGRRGEVHTELCRFVVFWAGSSLCLACLVTVLGNSDVIRGGEDGATSVAYVCITRIFFDLLFLLEYLSVLYEKDADGGGDEE